jgi:hypothetical protein
MIGKNDITDFRIDYKKDDWIRAIIDLKDTHSIVVHWDYIVPHNAELSEESNYSANDQHHVEESWTHTFGGEYCRSERESIISLIEATDEYRKLIIDWPFAAEIIRWKLKHPEIDNSALPPPDQYFGVY